MAHIVAFNEGGPRGKAALRPDYINDVSNLMLLCPQCHKLIDDQPNQYSVSVLQKYKESHENRIFHVTGLGPDKKTTVVQLKGRIAGQTIAIPVAQVTKAVAPRYPTDAKGHLIDLTAINSEGKAFIEEACRCIKQKVERLYEPGMDVHETRHISLFALAPIPLLVYLGSQLSNGDTLAVLVNHKSAGHTLISAMLATPFDGRFAVYGSLGWMEVRDKSHPEASEGWTLTRCRRGGQRESRTYQPAKAVLANLEAFSDAAAGRAPYPVPAEQMIANVAALEAVFRSAASGRVEEVKN